MLPNVRLRGGDRAPGLALYGPLCIIEQQEIQNHFFRNSIPDVRIGLHTGPGGAGPGGAVAAWRGWPGRRGAVGVGPPGEPPSARFVSIYGTFRPEMV